MSRAAHPSLPFTGDGSVRASRAPPERLCYQSVPRASAPPGLISRGDETAYRDEFQILTEWCMANNLALNASKAKELIIDFRKHNTSLTPLHVSVVYVERVLAFRFLGMSITEVLSWRTNTSTVVKKAQQQLYFLRTLRRNHLQ